MNLYSLAISCILIISLLADQASAAELMRWKLNSGDKLRVVTTQQTDSTVTYSGKSVPTSLELVVETVWDVEKAADDTFDIVQQVERLKVSMTSPDNPPIVYDTAADKRPTGAARQLETAIKPLLGMKFKVSMSARGEILKAEPLSLSTEDEKGAADEKSLNLSPETIQQFAQQSLLILPENEIEEGGSWKRTSETTTSLGKLKQTNNYTLKAIKGQNGAKTAQIEQAGQLDLAPADKKLKLTAHSLTGTIQFAIDGGYVISAEQSQRLKTESPYRETAIVVDLQTKLTTKIERVGK